ncbi:MAG TPA: hypothetical protein VGF38_15125 [Ktedonobacterales bacterium]|jgi:hypothetical protein
MSARLPASPFIIVPRAHNTIMARLPRITAQAQYESMQAFMWASGRANEEAATVAAV